MSDRSIWEWFWARHSNPKSGWSRALTAPFLVAAIYFRKPKLLLATVGYLVVNPIAFPEPERTDDWMTRGVLGEKRWVENGNPLFARSYPSVLNVVNVPTFCYVLYAAYRRKPVQAFVVLFLSMALKFWFVAEMVAYYDARGDE